MKVLITGATGLIGTRLTETLLEIGVQVNYLTTSKEKIKNKENYRGFYWNPTDNEIDVKAFSEVTAIIHLVGATIAKRWTKSYKQVILESRVQTANLIFETLQNIEHDITHFISASGISIYPSHKTKLYHENETEVANTFLGEVVVAWEAAADQFRNLGMRVVKIRTGVVFSKNDGAFEKMKQPIEKGVGAPLGSGKQWISWIYLDDIVGCYVHALKNGLEGVYNAVAPNPVTNKSLTLKMASALQMSLWLPNIPSFVLKLVLGEMASLVLESQLVSCKKIEASGYEFSFVNPNYVVQKLV